MTTLAAVAPKSTRRKSTKAESSPLSWPRWTDAVWSTTPEPAYDRSSFVLKQINIEHRDQDGNACTSTLIVVKDHRSGFAVMATTDAEVVDMARLGCLGVGATQAEAEAIAAGIASEIRDEDEGAGWDDWAAYRAAEDAQERLTMAEALQAEVSRYKAWGNALGDLLASHVDELRRLASITSATSPAMLADRLAVLDAEYA